MHNEHPTRSPSRSRRGRPRRGLALAVAVMLGVTLAACGDDDDTSGGGATVTSPAGGDATDASDATTDSTDAGDGGEAAGSDPDSDYCDAARGVQAVDTSALDSAATDADAMRDFFEEGLEAMERAQDEAPDEIADDIGVILGVFRELADVLEPYDYDFVAAAEDPELLALSERMDTDEVNEASDAIEEYNERVCGITPEDAEA